MELSLKGFWARDFWLRSDLTDNLREEENLAWKHLGQDQGDLSYSDGKGC